MQHELHLMRFHYSWGGSPWSPEHRYYWGLTYRFPVMNKLFTATWGSTVKPSQKCTTPNVCLLSHVTSKHTRTTTTVLLPLQICSCSVSQVFTYINTLLLKITFIETIWIKNKRILLRHKKTNLWPRTLLIKEWENTTNVYIPRQSLKVYIMQVKVLRT